jgi:tRNA U34 2-thiouridine synthase MnmA/TrmU
MGHGGDGMRRYVTHVDVKARRVIVGGAEAVARSSVFLAGDSVTWVDGPLLGGARALAQVSAHGRPIPCTVDTDEERGGLVIRFHSAQRPVAPGQTVALYDADDPDAVLGAGIAA